MNRPRLLSAVFAVLATGTCLTLSGCDFDAAKEAFTNAKIVLGLEDQKTTVGVRFVDAATGALLPGEFQVDLTGADAATVVDSYGDPLTKRTARGGLVGFSINNAKVPTSASPLAVRVSATPPGYLPISQSIVISDTGAMSVSVAALRQGAPSPGTQTASQQTTASSTTGIPASLTVTTPTTPPPGGGQAPPRDLARGYRCGTKGSATRTTSPSAAR